MKAMTNIVASITKRRRYSVESCSDERLIEEVHCSRSPEAGEIPEDSFCYKIFVRNLDRKTTEDELKTFFAKFAKFGKVGEVLKSQKSQTTAFVTFATQQDAYRVCQASSTELMCSGKLLRVETLVGEIFSGLQDVEPTDVEMFSSEHLGDDNSTKLEDPLTNFDVLPNEILSHLFSYLDVRHRIWVEAVCRRWREVGTTILWKTPKKLVLDSTRAESPVKHTFLADKDLITIFSRCGKNLKHLTLARFDGFTKKAVGLVGKHCPNLVEVKLCRVSLSNACLRQLANGCPMLKSISIQEASELRDDVLAEFLKKFEKLECFDLSKVGSSSFKKGEFCWGVNKKLRIFRATECRFLYPPIALAHVMSRCDSLEEFCLNFAWRSFTSASGNVAYQPEQDLMLEFFLHFRNTMKVVHLYGIGYIKDIDWRPPICILDHLEELWLDRCYGVDTRFFKCLSECCLKLRVLNVSSGNLVTDSGLSYLVSLPCLTVLEISQTQIEGNGLNCLAAHGRLEEIYVRACHYLKEDSLCVLAKSCSNLRLMDTSGTKQVSQVLVNTFKQCIEAGFLTPPIQLVVGGTSVVHTKNVFEGLELIFENTLNESKGYGTLYTVC